MSLYFPYIIPLSLYYHFLLTKFLYVLETLTFLCLSRRARWGQLPSRSLKVDHSVLHAEGFISQIQMANYMQHQTLLTMTQIIFSHACTSFWDMSCSLQRFPYKVLLVRVNTGVLQKKCQLSRTYGGIK